MDSLLKEAIEAIRAGQAPGKDAVKALSERYPYFTLPAAMELRMAPEELDGEERERLMRRVALTASNPSTLYMLLEREAADHADFYPDEKPATPTTENAIDSFLATYGHTSPEEEEILNRMIFNPTPDYAQLLAQEEQQSVPGADEAPEGSNDDRVNQFIIKQKAEQQATHQPAQIAPETVERRRSEEEPRPSSDDSLLSESLAKIFIKQQQYERAFEIISQLSLKYPEKSVYFADQLRFLRKVIANRKLRIEKQKQ